MGVFTPVCTESEEDLKRVVWFFGKKRKRREGYVNAKDSFVFLTLIERCTREKMLYQPEHSFILSEYSQTGGEITFSVHTMGRIAVRAYRSSSAARTEAHETHNPLY